MKLKIYFTAKFIMLEIDILRSIQFKMKNCIAVEKLKMRTLKHACAYTQLQVDCLDNRAGYSKTSADTHLCTCHVLAYTINHHRSCSHNCPRYFCICILNTGRPACICIHPHLGNSQKRTFEECLIIYFVSQTKENDIMLAIYKEASALVS